MEDEERDAGQLYTLARAILRPIFRFSWRFIGEGVENVPADGAAIMCPNHLSFIDHFCLPMVLDRRITYVGKAEYLDDWKTRKLLPALGMIPIDRRGGNAAQAALDAAARVLGRGELFGIYPEGTRSRDGRLHRGHTGAARLALQTGAPLVPVGLLGTAAVQPPDVALPRPFRTVFVRIGRPIDVSRYTGRVNDRLVLRQITDELMYEIRGLTGQDYVDSYATRKAEIPAEETRVASQVEEPEPRRSSAELLRA